MSNSLLKQLGLRAMQFAKEAEVPEVPAVAAGPDETILSAAEQAHEANRAYCVEQGDDSQLPWAEADQSIRDSAIRGVQAIMDGKVFNSKDSHDRWMEGKIAEGWTLGDVKDEAAKTHPSLVAYDQLPEHERMKDDIFVNTVKTALGMGEEVSETEVATVAAECMALVHSMETLEAMASTLETAPPEQLNETNAALINTVVQGVVGEDEGERMMPSIESYSLGSKRVLAAYAKEGIVDKMKEGGKNIIEKIIELIQKFWQWLTMNHKRTLASLKAASDAYKTVGNVLPCEMPMQLKYRQLFTSPDFSTNQAVFVGTRLSSLCEDLSNFIVDGFKVENSYNKVTLESDNVISKFKSIFGINKETMVLYNHIAGRTMTIALAPDAIAGIVIKTTLTKCEPLDYPDRITMSNADINILLNVAVQVTNESRKEFQKVMAVQNALKSILNNSLGLDYGSRHLLLSYNKAMAAFIDGVFMQALRYADTVASLTQNYVKLVKE